MTRSTSSTGGSDVEREPIVRCRTSLADDPIPPTARRMIVAVGDRPSRLTYAKGWGRRLMPDGTGKRRFLPHPVESVALRVPGVCVAVWTRHEGETSWAPGKAWAVWGGRIRPIGTNSAFKLLRSAEFVEPIPVKVEPTPAEPVSVEPIPVKVEPTPAEPIPARGSVVMESRMWIAVMPGDVVRDGAGNTWSVTRVAVEPGSRSGDGERVAWVQVADGRSERVIRVPDVRRPVPLSEGPGYGASAGSERALGWIVSLIGHTLGGVVVPN